LFDDKIEEGIADFFLKEIELRYPLTHFFRYEPDRIEFSLVIIKVLSKWNLWGTLE
jgi:hypothetical protein